MATAPHNAIETMLLEERRYPPSPDFSKEANASAGKKAWKYVTSATPGGTVSGEHGMLEAAASDEVAVLENPHSVSQYGFAFPGGNILLSSTDWR